MFKKPSKTLFLHILWTSTHANESKHATWNAFKNNRKTNPKSKIFWSKRSSFSILFGIDFQVRNLDVLGKVLGSILASISDHVGVQNDVRTASKNHHEKRCQHKPNMSPNMTPRGLPTRPHESAPRSAPRSKIAAWPLLCLTSRPEPNFGNMLDNFLIDVGLLLDQVSCIF